MRRTALIVITLASMIGLARCSTVYELTISPALDDAGNWRGFECVDDAGIPLAARIEHAPATIVVDVIDFGTDVLSCRDNTILDYCEQTGCPIVTRSCFPIDLDASNYPDGVAQLLAQLHAEDAAVSNIATDRSMMVRVVGITGSECPAPADAFDTNMVVGCGYSCPEHLDQGGALDVELDSLSLTECADAVAVCAMLEHLKQ